VAKKKWQHVFKGDTIVQMKHKNYMGAHALTTIALISTYAINALCLRKCGLTQIFVCWLYVYLKVFLIVTIEDCT